MCKKFYISTAIAYTSSRPHIGNVYEVVLADAIARFKRAQGFDVYFQTGTDEHGQKIEIKAKEANLSEQEYVDKISNEIKYEWDSMNTTYDKFVRTTDKHHEEVVQKIFKKLYDQGDIYKGVYSGKYCVPCESFFTETQLVDGKCPDCGRNVEDAKEEAYFLKLSGYTDRLIKYIEDNPDFISPESRKNEMLNNFIKPGLQDLCVSRTSFKWGVPVTFDDKHVIYVWVDALSNYITFLGYDVNGECGSDYKKYWPCDIHLIGKDILRFHTIYWPVILMALGEELPKKIFGHPWLLFAGDKMSKSKGNIMYASDLSTVFGVDGIRYFLLHEIPYANDGIITHELLIERYNSDLANILGNLVNRVIAMSKKYFDGVVNRYDNNIEIDNVLIANVSTLYSKVSSNMDKYQISLALDEIFNVLRNCNKYIDDTTPWILAHDETQKERLSTVLYNLVESLRIVACLLKPFLPDTSDSILSQLNISDNSFQNVTEFGCIENGHVLGNANVLFERKDKVATMEKMNSFNL